VACGATSAGLQRDLCPEPRRRPVQPQACAFPESRAATALRWPPKDGQPARKTVSDEALAAKVADRCNADKLGCRPATARQTACSGMRGLTPPFSRPRGRSQKDEPNVHAGRLERRVRRVVRQTMPGIHGFCSYYPFAAIREVPLLRGVNVARMMRSVIRVSGDGKPRRRVCPGLRRKAATSGLRWLFLFMRRNT